MNAIKDFMDLRKVEVANIIQELDSVFNSHEFIEKFSKKFESEYIHFLSSYKGNGAFRTVHALIAKFLSERSAELNIRKTKSVKSRNVFGDYDEIQEWEKI